MGILKSEVMCRFLYLIVKLLLLYANVMFFEMTITFSLICLQCILLCIMVKFILTSSQNFQFSCVSLPVNLHMYDGGPPFTVSGAAWCTIVSYKITLEFIKAVISIVITFVGLQLILMFHQWSNVLPKNKREYYLFMLTR